MSDSGSTADGRPDVGTLAEETERLVGALAGWAREHSVGLAGEVEEAADHLARSLREAGAHAPGGADCQWCPVCRGVGAIRNLNPEVRTHLLVAATSLVHAAAAALDTSAPEPADAERRVERIDIEGREWEDE